MQLHNLKNPGTLKSGPSNPIFLGEVLNDYLLSLVLGVVEGLTEFLPVSSTAHLRIAEALMHVSLSDPYWKMYTIVIQLGAILCLPIYFRERIAKFLSTFPQGEGGDRTLLTHPLSLTIIAFVVTAIPAFLLTKVIGAHLESLHIIGAALLIGGIVMWIIDGSKAKWEKAGPSGTGQSDQGLAHGGDEPFAGGLDRGLPDTFGGVSGNVAVDVHDRGGAGGGDVAGFGAGIFVLSFDAHDGCGDSLRPA